MSADGRTNRDRKGLGLKHTRHRCPVCATRLTYIQWASDAIPRQDEQVPDESVQRDLVRDWRHFLDEGLARILDRGWLKCEMLEGESLPPQPNLKFKKRTT